MSGERVVIICQSQRNTRIIAEACADVLGAHIVNPKDASMGVLVDCDLIGLGSGIYGGRHAENLFFLVQQLPPSIGKRFFLFSTACFPWPVFHAPLRGMLLKKGFTIAGEFTAPGFTTFGPLKLFGGAHKGRPDARDIARAQKFAAGLAYPGASAQI
jgi:flavodoxin